MGSISNRFNSKNILFRIVSINQNLKKCKRYTTDLNTNNDKSYLYIAFQIIKIENINISNGYIYTNINKAR